MATFSTIAKAAAVAGGGIVLIGTSVAACWEMDRANKIKEQVKETGISVKDFEAIEKKALFSSKGPVFSNMPYALTWQQALDSLRMKGNMEKAYLEGANMVRDSIKNAAKTLK